MTNGHGTTIRHLLSSKYTFNVSIEYDILELKYSDNYRTALCHLVHNKIHTVTLTYIYNLYIIIIIIIQPINYS